MKRSIWESLGLCGLLCGALVGGLQGQEPSDAAQDYVPSAENLAARHEFRDAQFGLFIHWGVYSLLGDGEWVLNNHKLSLTDYALLPPQFNPQGFDAEAWVSLAKAAGMRYLTVTAKHHDGFCLFDSQHTDWDIVDASPFRRDVMRELADECHRQGVKLFFYYSHLDWHHPDYYPWGQTGWNTGRAPQGDFDKYLDYVDAQLTELLTNYGSVAGIWFDGWWDKPEAPWRLRQTYDLIHRLQPAALILNNHHQPPFPGEDLQGFEKDLPGQNLSGLNDETQIGRLPLESCDTISRAWGYNEHDRTLKSLRDLAHYLVRAAGSDANFLLNVGPQPDGAIQPEFAARLEGLGVWLQAHGETIYGTRGGPLPPAEWGVTTQTAEHVYVHVLEPPDGPLVLEGLPGKVRSVRLLQGEQPVELQQRRGRVALDWPRDEPGEPAIDTVFVLTLEYPAE